MKNPYQPASQYNALAGDDTILASVPVDRGQCLLLGPTALIVQALMGVLVIASLVFKRYREHPRRPWRVWTFDVSKQVIGQAFVHGLNLLISGVVANISQGNPCDLYFLNILIDTTIGVGYIYLILHFTDRLFTDYFRLNGFKSGQYGDPPSLNYWFRQAFVYVLTILTMKLLVVGLFALWPGIFDVAEFLLNWADGKDKLRIIFVMGIFPIIMNVLQFWLIDSIVKASAAIQLGHSADDSIRHPLFRDPNNESDDDDGNDDHFVRRRDIESPPTPQKTHPQNEDSAAEYKSTASESSTTVADSTAVQVHRYPPGSSYSGFSSNSNSPTTPSTSPTATLRHKTSRRRSPPPPIRKPSLLKTELNYTISSTPSPMPAKQFYTSNSNAMDDNHNQRTEATTTTTIQQSLTNNALVLTPQTAIASGSPWSTWVNDSNWAERVGQDEWDSRRLDKKKMNLDLWNQQNILDVPS